MTILGLHHITLVCTNAQRTVNFYVRVLGQRLVKQTVNFDDPGAYHLYFGDRTGRPATALTFFEWKNAGRHRHGIGGTHHVALRVADFDGLLKWKRRLTDLGITVRGPYDRHYFRSIYFNDPDGVILEIATDGPGFAIDEAADSLGRVFQSPPVALMEGSDDYAALAAQTWDAPVSLITPEMALLNGMHHITAISADIERTDAFFSGLLGMQRVKMTANFDDASSPHWYWGIDGGRPGTLITYFQRDPQKTPRAVIGAGMTHHFALAVKDEAEQMAWRERLLEAGCRVSPVMDRDYFRSIYTSDPDGHIVELATLAPGFAVDEPLESLGMSLQLPTWLQPQRTQIEQALTPLEMPNWREAYGDA